VDVQITVHRGRLGPTEHRVIRPAEPLDHAALRDDDRWLNLYADQDAATRIGALWLLAARSRRSLVHLPLRAGLPGDEPWLDLVLLHHSLRFRPADWKELRNRLDQGRPQRARVPETDRTETERHYPDRHFRENRKNRLNEQVHAATLFLVGSADLFRLTAERLFDVAEHGPTSPVRQPDGHYCAEFHPYDGILGNARRFHIQYVGDWS
jgi:hypothetical protein